MTKRVRRSFTKEFKEQIVQLHVSGKPRAEIIKEYELTPSAFDKWVRSVSAMCDVLQMARSTYYYEAKIRDDQDEELTSAIIDIFNVLRDRNPYPTVIIVTNCFELSANEIGELYRYRWKIETFFKWMKQHLKIKSFYGKSENAVCNQIWIALITYCLQVLLQQSVHHEGPLLEIKQTIKTLLFDGFDVFLCALPGNPRVHRKDVEN
ncbi:transposase [Halalkalibacter lacteus]|uniref:transposase n=1 Tax=Halalkalibacter lacteus TaxID=3090663 RepID=UPI002FC96F8F